jgi:GTP-binding protein Era
MPEDRRSSDSAAAENGTRFGFVAVIGAPNAGKSTLVNRLVGTKVTIVSRKVQTTRMPIRGIAMIGDSQLVLVDTPGIFAPRRRLDRAMVGAAWAGAAEADLIVLVVDAAKGVDPDVDRLLAGLAASRVPKVLALNKVDRLKHKAALLALAASLSEKAAFEAVFMISALDGQGVGDLARYLARSVPQGPWHYAADEPTALPLRLLAAELTREKIYDHLHDELPYAAAVETTQWQEQKDGSVRVEQTIYVERESQRKIALGKGGATIKRISTESRKELMEILERPVHLFLFVKVRAGWGDDPERYRELGLDFPSDED